MSTNKLFERWTWSYPIPKPFDDIETVRTDIKSCHNTSRTAKSTLHGATLSGILAYMELEADPSAVKGAVGTQNDMVIAEYPSHRPGETHTVVFNRKSGKFIAGVFDSSGNMGNYTLTETGNTGSAMFFALMPLLLEDDEFNESYTTLLECRKDNYSDMQKAEDAAFVLCDNAYRRIAHPSASDNFGIRITMEDWAINDMRDTDTHLFSNRESAELNLRQLINEFFAYDNPASWRTEQNFEEEAGELYYKAWLDGDYRENHYEIAIIRKTMDLTWDYIHKVGQMNNEAYAKEDMLTRITEEDSEIEATDEERQRLVELVNDMDVEGLIEDKLGSADSYWERY